ncbi:hypothetical protein OG216_47775 (plasmid) [Streptomycetaceae bacterium NBC_01309]
MATRRRLGTGPAPTTQALPGQAPRLLAAERSAAPDPRSAEDGDGDQRHVVAEASTATRHTAPARPRASCWRPTRHDGRP